MATCPERRDHTWTVRQILSGCVILAGAAAIWRWSIIRDEEKPSRFIRIANFNNRAGVLFLSTIGVAAVVAGLLSLM